MWKSKNASISENSSAESNISEAETINSKDNKKDTESEKVTESETAATEEGEDNPSSTNNDGQISNNTTSSGGIGTGISDNGNSSSANSGARVYTSSYGIEYFLDDDWVEIIEVEKDDGYPCVVAVDTQGNYRSVGVCATQRGELVCDHARAYSQTACIIGTGTARDDQGNVVFKADAQIHVCDYGAIIAFGYNDSIHYYAVYENFESYKNQIRNDYEPYCKTNRTYHCANNVWYQPDMNVAGEARPCTGTLSIYGYCTDSFKYYCSVCGGNNWSEEWTDDDIPGFVETVAKIESFLNK